MAEANVGFADERYVLINGEHWHSNEKRRPVLLQAWYAQFADILLTEILGNPIFGTQPSFGTIQEKGAHDDTESRFAQTNSEFHELLL